VRANPASFDDHFSQATMFFRSMSAIEQAHIVEAYTFELSKCYEQPIRERQLQALANIDADLSEQVAAGLGLPAPKGEPAKDVTLSPALSQVVTEPGPIAGRKIGVIADAGSDLAGIAKLRRGRERPGRGAHPGDGQIDRVRHDRHRGRHRAVERHQAGHPAPGGLPPFQGARRLG
jgi:catalase